MHGMPEGSADIQPLHAYPIELNLNVMGGRASPFLGPICMLTRLAVDFRKGCYVGQELTMWTYHTGVVRK